MFGDRKRRVREVQRKRQGSPSRSGSSGSFTGTSMSHSTFDNYDSCDCDRDYGGSSESSDSSSCND